MGSSLRAGRGLAGLLVACAGVLALFLGARVVSARSPRAHPPDATPAKAASLERAAGLPSKKLASAREELAATTSATSTAEAATATITGRLQINGFAARRGRVLIRTGDGHFVRELDIDPYGRFYAEGVPAGELLLACEAEGLFERALVLPDRHRLAARAGELEVVDLDWWTRQVNVFVGGEAGDLRAARVLLSGPGYDSRSFETDEDGVARLDLVGQGIFTFQARTADGREDRAELEFEVGDELDTVVLVPRVKKS